MYTSLSDIERILREEDIEGLIEVGAPADEYDSEAAALMEALARLEHVSQETVSATIALVWTKFFDLGSAEVAQRMAAFEAAARRILS